MDTATPNRESMNIDRKIDWLIRTLREMKVQSVCEREVKIIIRELVQEKLATFKREFEELKELIHGGSSARKLQRSYSEIVNKRREKM